MDATPDDITTRLRRALVAALKARDTSAVSALRSALSAIGNAEAVEVRPGRVTEFSRVLAPRGYLLLAFQAGDEPLHLTEALGHPVSLEFRRRRPERVAELLRQAGLVVRAQLLREPADEGDFTERTPQAFILARKPRG